VRPVQVFRIRITPERAPGVRRVFELSARHTLYDVHAAIQDAFELDDDHPHAFFMSGRHWDAASEVDTGRTPRTRLDELGLEAGKRFAYVFDFGDELWHELEVEAVVETETPPREPRQVESLGDAPSQYPDDERDHELDASALVPLAKELVALFPFDEDEDDAELDADADDDDLTHDRGFTHDHDPAHAHDNGLDHNGLDHDELDDGDLDDGDLDDGDLDDEPDHPSAMDLEPAALESARAIAARLARELDGNADLFFALEEAVRSDLLSLLADLPVALAHAERVDEGAELASTLAFLDPPHFLGDRAIILAESGRREEALAQVTHNLEFQSDDLWATVKAAEVYSLLDDPVRAEALLRSALAEAEDDAVRDGALDRLLDLLSSQGRNQESNALLSAERARLDALIKVRQSDTVRPGGTVQRTVAKVGRNDPCPCGSGKKHKKCCLD
jgi:hypothetical protein